jgi:hypothetical protein
MFFGTNTNCHPQKNFIQPQKNFILPEQFFNPEQKITHKIFFDSPNKKKKKKITDKNFPIKKIFFDSHPEKNFFFLL